MSDLEKLAQQKSQKMAHAEREEDAPEKGYASPPQKVRKLSGNRRPSLSVSGLNADHGPKIKSPLGTRPVVEAESDPTPSSSVVVAAPVVTAPVDTAHVDAALVIDALADRVTSSPLNPLSIAVATLNKDSQYKELWEIEAKRRKEQAIHNVKMAEEGKVLRAKLDALKQVFVEKTAELRKQLKESNDAKVRAEDELAKIRSHRAILQNDALLALERVSDEMQFIQEISKLAFKESQNVRQLLHVVKGEAPDTSAVLGDNEERSRPRQNMADSIGIMNAFEAEQLMK
ncbi:hypothetical protein B0J13DRAFT_523479 [Dactylonectria estremocensis]|uniref:Uncharacterized protein n=1 Tax=Dactylonectria estremocensis TaxID=1079267 RepID=A0A9P9F2J9_9HYPO|nr:hypothetical protein B0J13DRAFT_523479 [Dactylonectria estremocensis]